MILHSVISTYKGGTGVYFTGHITRLYSYSKRFLFLSSLKQFVYSKEKCFVDNERAVCNSVSKKVLVRLTGLLLLIILSTQYPILSLENSLLNLYIRKSYWLRTGCALKICTPKYPVLRGGGYCNSYFLDYNLSLNNNPL